MGSQSANRIKNPKLYVFSDYSVLASVRALFFMSYSIKRNREEGNL